MRRLFVALACFAAAACPAPRETIPAIRVASGAAGRWARWVDRESGEPGPASPKPARVHVLRDGEQLGGPNAIGRPGDLLLENDEVVFVIDQLGSSAGFAESGGNLVDAADARARKDELGQIFSYFGVFPRQGVYDALSSGVAADGSAWVEARGRELYAATLVVTTRYTLRPPDRALLLETTLENTGGASTDIPSLGDVIQWGDAEKVAPGKPRGFKGESSGPYLGGVGRFTSYALTSTDGAIEATSGTGWSDTAQRKGVSLRPGENIRYARVFVVGERPDTSSIVGELAMAAGQPIGNVQVRLPAAALLPTGSSVTLFVDGSSETLTLAPPYAGHVPVGRYRVAPLLGRSGGQPVGPIEVRPGWTTNVDVPVESPATLDVHCVGLDGVAMPCKLSFEGIGPTPTPEFGSVHCAGPARNQSTAGDGNSRVVLAPGNYRVTASRGPEFALAAVEVVLAPSDHRSETLSLARVVDTRGYLACDFHQHTMIGTDAPVGVRDRVIANVAEGVELAVASEHNVVADLEPVVKELHLERELVEIPGDELTSDASRHPWGHANAFPLSIDTSKPRGGAPRVRDRSAPEVFAELRARPAPDLVIQINHPRSGKNGYFDLLGFDRARGAGTDSGYAGSFDAVEVWNGRNVEARAAVLDDWRALLRAGHAVTATADTDTHGIVGQEAGYPRTYVRVANDGDLGAWDAGRTADLIRGIKVLRDVVLTNGPMLRVSANGAPIGGLAHGRAVTVKVHVECAPWIDVDTVRVLHARESEEEKPVRVKLAALPSGARGADLTLSVRVDADDAIFVVASGQGPLSPVLGGDEHEIRPWAMSGAIWVDADGDGRALGRAREGQPAFGRAP